LNLETRGCSEVKYFNMGSITQRCYDLLQDGNNYTERRPKYEPIHYFDALDGTERRTTGNPDKRDGEDPGSDQKGEQAENIPE
jgi:hypothetical protein